MKEDIIINGVSVNELKRQRDAIKKGASKIISENIEKAKKITNQLVLSDSADEIKSLAQEAYDALDTANIVSGVSGVTFSLPFYEEYGNYESDEIFSHKLEDSDNKGLSENWDAISDLYYLFENMEIQSRDWHSSRC